jgi:hypothetical protein
MVSRNEPGSGVVPSARVERQRTRRDDTIGIVAYACALGLIAALAIGIVALA